MDQHNTGTDQDGVRQWLAADFKRRADRLGHIDVIHLIAESFEACHRGRITAAAGPRPILLSDAGLARNSHRAGPRATVNGRFACARAR